MSINSLDRNVSEELKAALNLIAKYCSEQLPDGWDITISVNSEEISVSLSDPQGDDHDGWESGDCCHIVDACDYALYTHFD